MCVITVIKLNAKAYNCIQKRLGLPRCFSDVALFGRNALLMPLKNIATAYRLEKTRLVLELKTVKRPICQDCQSKDMNS